MEQGSELSKTVATFILQKILTDDTGLAYICQTYERFSHVAKVLGLMVINLGRLLYIYLTDILSTFSLLIHIDIFHNLFTDLKLVYY